MTERSLWDFNKSVTTNIEEQKITVYSSPPWQNRINYGPAKILIIERFPTDTDPFKKGLNSRTELAYGGIIPSNKLFKLVVQMKIVNIRQTATLLQLMSRPSANHNLPGPLFQFEIRNKQMCLRGWAVNKFKTAGSQIYLGAFPENEWIEVEIEGNLRQDHNGYLGVKVDGKKLWELNGPMKDNAVGVGFQGGVYHNNAMSVQWRKINLIS